MGIKVTVIGCGAVVERLYMNPLRLLEKRRMIDVVGLVDKDLSRADVFRKYFRTASAYDNLTTAIEKTNSQLTIVASPATLHAEHSILAMRNGNHVLCEKPMAVTKAQCQHMNDSACNTGMKLSIGMIRRYYPSMVRAKALIESGAIGDVLSFTYREGRPYNWPVATAERFRRAGGGGILLDMGSHALDALIWLFGEPRIVAYSDDSMNNGVEASCVIKLDFNGISGLVHLSWDYELLNKLIIMGTKGRITVALGSLDGIVALNDDGALLPLPEVAFPTSLDPTKPITATARTVHDCIYIHIVQVLRSILQDQPPVFSGNEGLSVISAIEDCYRIAEPIDMNWLPAEQNVSFKRLHWRKRPWNQ